MNSFQTEAHEPQSLQESCIAFGNQLGLDGPVSEQVMLSAIADPTYTHNLLVSRKVPLFLEHLLKNPPSPPESKAAGDDQEQQRSNGMLLKESVSAFWRWSKSGFAQLDEAAFQRRYQSCLACEHLQDPPGTMLYKVASLGLAERNARKICGLCGCTVSRKARLPTEACPGRDPHNSTLNRWGEPFREAKS
jgi:hypothetical protein